MRFIKIEMASWGAPDRMLTLGAVLPVSEWPNDERGEAEEARCFIEGCLQRDGAMLLKDSEGVTRYFGASVMAHTAFTATVIEMPDAA